MLSLLTSNLLWTEGLYIVLVLGATAILGVIVWRPLAYVSLFLFLFSFYFFRNPARMCPEALHDDTVLICPADGQVVDVQYDPHNGIEGYAQKVSIFLSPIDVHVQWLPVAGTIERIVYKPGTFSFAFLPKSSELNERNDVFIRAHNGQSMVVRQIAGSMARRIRCWVHEGQQVAAGQKYGMIRFGSRVDMLLPENVHVSVGIGQQVLGGQTVLGRWNTVANN